MNEYRLSQVKMPLDHHQDALKAQAARLLGLKPGDIDHLEIEKKSVDARDKSEIRIVYALRVSTRKKPLEVKTGSSRGGKDRQNAPRVWEPAKKIERYAFPYPAVHAEWRPLVVGSGPGGLFAALMLAQAGLRPVVLERGDDVDARMASVKTFHQTGRLDPESNIQFGEGGAGTFSDGKLTTLVNDHQGRNRRILEEFVQAGAPEEILWTGKPHVGTDCLVGVVKNIRKKIIALGGEVRFRSKVTSLVVEGGRIHGVIVNGTEEIASSGVILAVGHSARDMFEHCASAGIPLEAKAFAMGVRIEHPQEMIGLSQFGPSWRHPALPVADYKLADRTRDGRGVYTFCMCPGGWVVNASSEPGRVVCNGMSYQARDGRNANAAVLVTVEPADFPGQGVLAGMEFQRYWEAQAFAAGGGTHALPVQTFRDFEAGQITDRGLAERLKSLSPDVYGPAIEGLWNPGRVDQCLPDFVRNGIIDGIHGFDRKIRGFARPDAVLTGVETRSSSPVRILRDESGQSAVRGLFPCGEGAGYAGGIMSAAMDGLKAAEALAASLVG